MTESGELRPAAFFSYVRADDEHDRGYLTEIRRALAAEVGMQTGAEFFIFQDRNDILWGQRWRTRIEESIDASTVLLAVLTPRFFTSKACREELERFLDRENQLDRHDLILPIYYISVPGWGEGAEDHLLRNLATRQYEDWRELRFESLDSPPVRRKIAHLAQLVVSAVTRGTSLEPARESGPDDSEESSDEWETEQGFVELVAEAEEAMPLFSQTIVDFTVELDRVGELAKSKAQSMATAKAGSMPSKATLTLIHKLGVELEEPTLRIETLAADYVDQLVRVDGGVRALLGQLPQLVDSEEIESARELAETLSSLDVQGSMGLDALDEFRHSLRDVGKLSSTLRPILRRIDRALIKVVPSREVFSEWATAFDREIQLLDKGGSPEEA